MAVTKAKQLRIDIENDLREQLKALKKSGKYFEDLVSDYMNLYDLKTELKKDIKENGLRIICKSGNGFDVEKPNESIKNLLSVNAQMLKLLNDLGLQIPTIVDDNNEDSYL